MKLPNISLFLISSAAVVHGYFLHSPQPYGYATSSGDKLVFYKDQKPEYQQFTTIDRIYVVTEDTHKKIVRGRSGEAVLAKEGKNAVTLNRLYDLFTVCDEHDDYYTVYLDEVKHENCELSRILPTSVASETHAKE